MDWHKTTTQIAKEASRLQHEDCLTITEPMALPNEGPYAKQFKRLVLLSFLYLSNQISICNVQAIAQSPDIERDICVVIGTEGQSEYGEAFRAWAKRWQEAFATPIENNSKSDESKPEDLQAESPDKAPTRFLLIDGTNKEQSVDSSSSDHRSQLLKWIARETTSPTEPYPHERWLVLIGHGTHDPTQKTGASKFNLQGPDISSEMLANAINKASEPPVNQKAIKWIIVNCSSCSGPFINALSGPNRIVLTATKSGSEQNFARFGDYFSQALSNPEADLDHDKSISLLEAFLIASNETSSFYTSDGRLASEQSLLDDNGDQRGTPAVFFQGVRPVKAPAENLKLDGFQSKRTIIHKFSTGPAFDPDTQLKIECIEDKIEALRSRKKDLPEEQYYEELATLFREIVSLRAEKLSK